MRRHAAIASGCLLLAACGGDNTPPTNSPPGGDTTSKTQALEAGAAVLQDKAPLDALNSYLDGFHFASGNMAMQMEAHHYCGHLNEDVIQCVIYDGNTSQAKLMGIEYIVTQALFEKLPSEEKRLWHSHVHEVKSGQLIAPGIPGAAEHELMRKLVGTYGKTWHTWNTHAHSQDSVDGLPLGGPLLMMGFTADGQADEQRVAERDRRFDVSSATKREQRADIPAPPIDPGADAWQEGEAVQVQLAPLPTAR
jgi:hypothetical protein